MTNQNNAAQAAHIDALQDLRLGVEMDRHNLPDGDAKLAALDAALALLRAPVADEAQPTDAEIIDLAVEPLGIDCDRMPHGVVVFARNLLSRYAAPQASEAVRDAALEEAHNLALAQLIHAVSGMWVEDVTLPEVITAIHAINLHSAKATADLTLPPLPPGDLMAYPGGDAWPFPKVAYFNAASMTAYARAALSAQPGAQRTGGGE